MSFAVPGAFWLAWCAIPIVIYYILKLRLRRQTVSTNLFWRQIYHDQPPRSIWQALRHLGSLLAQLLVLTLLVLAAADPFLPWQRVQTRRIVAVVDRSASMQGTDVTPTRFTAAIDSAQAHVQGLRFGDQMAIVAAGPQAEVVLGMTDHTPSLQRALRGIKVSDGSADMAAAIQLAQRIVGDHPHGEVIVFTDGCADGIGPHGTVASDGPVSRMSAAAADGGEDVGSGASIEWRIFTGPHPANVGITQFQGRRSLADPLGYDLSIAVTNASDRPVHGRLEIELNGIPVDVLPWNIAGDKTWRRTLQKTSLEGGILTASLVRIEPQDDRANDERTDTPNGSVMRQRSSDRRSGNDLHLDDVASTSIPPRTRQHVLLITHGNRFLQTVLEANALVHCEVLSELPAEIPTDAVVVLHRQVPTELPPVDLLVIDPVEDSSDWRVGDVLENPIVTSQQTDSPLMTHVRLDNVMVHQARQITFNEPPEVLASTITGDVVYAEWKRAIGKGLVLTIDLDESDLAFRTAFPILVANALRWFRDDDGELETELTSRQALARFRESDLRPRSKGFSASTGGTMATGSWARPLWFYLAIAVTVLVVVEWCLYQRRVIQ